MKRKNKMKHFKIGFSLLMTVVMVLSVLQYGLAAKQTPVKAAVDISTSNYKTWTAATLSEARDSVNKFLTPLKGSDTERPYKGNTTWQEGSLAALDKVYYAAVSPDTGISSDLARQQLIQTVRGLELYDSGSYTGRNIALNDYPDDALVYDLAQIVNGVESASSIKGDQVAFFTDYGGGMNGQIPGGTSTTYRYVQDVLFEYYNRIAITNSNGYNPAGTSAFYSGYTQPTDQNTPNLPMSSLLTKDFGRTTSNFNNYNKNDALFRQLLGMSNPTSFGSAGSNLPAYVRYMTGVFNGKPNHGAFSYEVAPRFSRPVLILISNYEFSSEAMKQDFLKSLDEFENSTDIKARTSGKPVFIQISLKRDGATNYDPMVDKIFTPGRIAKGWRHLELSSANATDPSSFMNKLISLENYPLIKNDVLMGNIRGTYLWDYANSAYLPMGQLSEMLWNSTLTANQFNFVQNSFGGSFSEQVSMTDTELQFKGNGNGGISRFDMTAANNQYTGYKMGDKLAAYNSATIFVGATPSTYNASPKLFVPVSDAAVELYTYSGSGSEASASSYTLKDTIVSNTYQNYGGTSYSLNTGQLACKKYGTVLSQADLKNAVKDAMGETAYNSLDFTNSNSLNASSLTVNFDASKNVYKLYAKEATSEGTVTFEFYDSSNSNAVIKPAETTTGAIGAEVPYNAPSGYTLSSTNPNGIDPTKVVYEEGSKTIKLYYTKNPVQGTVTFEYYDISNGGVQIKEPDTTTGTVGGTVPYSPPSGYTLSFTNPNGIDPTKVVYEEGTKKIQLYYTKNPAQGTVTFEYYDITNGGIQIKEPDTSTGTVGNSVPYNAPNGYTLSFTNPSGIDPTKVVYEEGTKTIRLYYTKNPVQGTVIFEYYDISNGGVQIKEPDTRTGTVGDLALYSPPNGYTLSFTNPTGTDPTKVKFEEGTKKIQLYYTKDPTEANLTVKFVDEEGNDIVNPVVKSKTIGVPVNLKTDSELGISAILTELEKMYILVERPTNETAFAVTAGGVTATYKFEGQLMLTVPSLIDFGTHKVKAASERINSPKSITGDLTVQDTRAKKTSWKITARISDPVHHVTNTSKVINDGLVYVYNGKDVVLNAGEQPVSTGLNSSSTQVYNINNTWSAAGDGLKFQINTGAVNAAGNYTGEITWSLVNGP